MPEPQEEIPQFAARLARLREERGWSQKQLAARIGCRPGLVSKFETGRRTPRAALLVHLGAALGVSVDELLGVPQKGGGRDAPQLAERVRQLSRRLAPAQLPLLVAFLDALLALVGALRPAAAPGGEA